MVDGCQSCSAQTSYHGPVNKHTTFLPVGRRSPTVLHRCKLAWMVLALATAGCSSMLPRGVNATSSFTRFEALRDSVDSLRPMTSDRHTLMQLGIDPDALPNTTILTYADLLRRFAPGTVAIKEDLDPGIVACLAARDACRGWELNVAYIERVRGGGFWADFFNFRRHTATTGWRFNALILLAGDVVVYRSWGGQPSVNETDDRTNPLGPLQEIGPAIAVQAP
jgi:hypothetical protein